MNIIERIISIPEYDPLRYLKFSENKFENISLYLGAQGDIQIEPNKINIFYDAEEPNMWFWPDSYRNAILNEQRYQYIFSICPYTSTWRNNLLKSKKYITIPHFINKNYIFENEKEFDIIYTGHVNQNQSWIYNFLSPFNYVIISGNNLSYIDKMKTVSKSKISLIHNLLFMDSAAVNNIKKIPNYKENLAFNNIDLLICPQIKTRLFEAAASKSLILCKKDPWNVIEDYFTKDEFIYFENNPKDIIIDILNNYNTYKPMIERAYLRVINNYTTEKLSNYLQQTK